MQVMYCSKCGALISSDAIFCPKCGTKVSSEYTQNTYNSKGWNYQSNQQNQNQNWNSFQQAPKTNRNLWCALAYIPVLFWLPLVADSQNPLSKKSANQGLLLLILNVIVQVIFSVINEIFDFTDHFFFLSFPMGILSSIVNMISIIIHLALVVCVIVGIIRTLNGEEFEIPIVGKIQLIK